MTRKKRERPLRGEQLNLLSKYFDVDRKLKLVTIHLHYEKASDLIDSHIGKGDHYFYDADAFQEMIDLLKVVPNGYRVAFVYDIQDYEGTTPDLLMENLRDQIDMNYYEERRQIKRKRRGAFWLLLTGIAILVAMGLIHIYHVFGEGELADVIGEVLDLAGSVFVWEAVTVAFLETSEIRGRMFIARNRIASIAFASVPSSGLKEAKQSGESLFGDGDSPETALIEETREQVVRLAEHTEEAFRRPTQALEGRHSEPKEDEEPEARDLTRKVDPNDLRLQ